MRDPQEVLAPLEREGIRLGLADAGRLLDALGRPQARGGQILVAGTNGKGSTAALLASILEAAGYSTGLYTSPHLEDVAERVRVRGAALAGARLAEALERVVATAEGLLGHPPTYFEATTAAAFLAFAAAAVDFEVLEVGLGGRLDATNLAQPELSLVTPIGLDHTELLGETTASIAREKAGIFRAGVPALGWVEDAAAAAVLAVRAAEVGTPWTRVDRQARWCREGWSWEGQWGVLETPESSYALRTRLLGDHQGGNLALAVRAAETLRQAGAERIGPEAITAGVEACRWPARLEPVALPGGRRVLLDAAHNPLGVERLARFLAQAGEEHALLFGALADKPAAAMLERLAPQAASLVLTRPASPRALDPERLAALPGLPPCRVEPDPETALDLALRAPQGLLVACGSIYLVGAVRQALRRRFGVPEAAVAVRVTG